MPLEPSNNEPVTEFTTEPTSQSTNGSANESANESKIELARLHWTSLLFDVISHGRNYLIPAVLALFSAAQGSLGGVIVAGIIFIPALATSVFRYFTLRYSIRDRQLVVTKGLIFRSVRTVPVSRIQNVDFVQNVLHRIFGVAEVRVETASGTEPEATLRVLSMQQMEHLRNEIFELQSETNSPQSIPSVADATKWSADPYAPQPIAVGAASSDVTNFNVASSTVPLLKIRVRSLVIAGLASNRGLIMAGVVLGLFFQSDLNKRFDVVKQFEQLMPHNADTLTLIFFGTIALIGWLIVLRILGVGWYLLRFFNYQLVRRGDDLQISCGLLTKVSATVPRPRIQFISIHRNWIMRWLKFSSIRIETAGGAGKNHEDATTTVSRRWFVPIVPDDEVPRLLAELRPGLHWDESSLNFEALAPTAVWRLGRLAVLQSLFVALIGFAITRPWGWVAGIIALPILILWTVKKSRAMRYARTDDGVVFRSGVLVRKTSLTFFEKVQAIRVEQSPFDRRWNMASLSVDTAAAGPANHTINIPLLDAAFAMNELEALRERTSRQQPVFG